MRSHSSSLLRAFQSVRPLTFASTASGPCAFTMRIPSLTSLPWRLAVSISLRYTSRADAPPMPFHSLAQKRCSRSSTAARSFWSRESRIRPTSAASNLRASILSSAMPWPAARKSSTPVLGMAGLLLWQIDDKDLGAPIFEDTDQALKRQLYSLFGHNVRIEDDVHPPALQPDVLPARQEVAVPLP